MPKPLHYDENVLLCRHVAAIPTRGWLLAGVPRLRHVVLQSDFRGIRGGDVGACGVDDRLLPGEGIRATSQREGPHVERVMHIVEMVMPYRHLGGRTGVSDWSV